MGIGVRRVGVQLVGKPIDDFAVRIEELGDDVSIAYGERSCFRVIRCAVQDRPVAQRKRNRR